MGYRIVTDSQGTEWQAWVLSQGLNGGWLCFEAPAEKRRLAPVPTDWLRCAVARLEEYLRAALPAPRVNDAVKLPIIAAIDRRAG